MKRINSIDFTRGLVMIIMALDHARDFLHVHSMNQSPTNLAQTTPILFFTRWITHLCAPTFVFLSGTSAFLSLRNRPDQRANRRFLWKRGLWLILLEFTLVNFALWMDIRFRMLIFEVIGTIGFGFIMISVLYKVSGKVLGIIGLLLIFGHDLLTSLILPIPPGLNFAASFLFAPGQFQITPHLLLTIAYPVLPWLGIMLAGFSMGRLFEMPVEIRKKILLRTALASLGLFILLRFINVYGDPFRWSVQKDAVFTILSFLNVSKYPPSLLFTLVTLGISLLVLCFSEEKDGPLVRISTVYGKTPLFYFVVHLYILHLIMLLMVFLQGFSTKDMDFGPMKFGRPDKGSGIGLFWVYLIWIAVVVLMYPLCRKFGSYKLAHRSNPWLRYL